MCERKTIEISILINFNHYLNESRKIKACSTLFSINNKVKNLKTINNLDQFTNIVYYYYKYWELLVKYANSEIKSNIKWPERYYYAIFL